MIVRSVAAVVRLINRVLIGTLLLLGSLYFTAQAAVIGGFAGAATLPAECAVVFGAAVRPVFDSSGNHVSTVAGPGIDRRVSMATDLYRSGQVKRIFMTGGTGQGMRQSEAAVMRTLALKQGVDPLHVIAEEEARSTEENIAFTHPMAQDCESTVAISDRYHLMRIAFLARAKGWEIGTIPAKKAPDWRFEGRSAIREALILSVLTLEHLLT